MGTPHTVSPHAKWRFRAERNGLMLRRRLGQKLTGALILIAITLGPKDGPNALCVQIPSPAEQSNSRSLKNGERKNAGPQSSSPSKVGLTDWGKSVNGLSSRIVPVSGEMSEDDIKLDSPIGQFDSFEDLAFAVEFKNTTDQPMKLLDTRYGNSFGASSGKANSNWIGQYLFSLMVFDQDGRQLVFPKVEIVGGLHPASSALVSSVAAGKTHRFLLRPGKWLRVLSPRLKPGRYRAAVRYHGLSQQVAEKLNERKKDAAAAWSGELISPPASFEIKPSRQPQPKSTWGEPTSGIRTAIQLVPTKLVYKSGEKPTVVLRIQNVAKESITIACGLWLSELKLNAVADAQKEQSISTTFYSGWTLVGRITLTPKQIVEIDAGNIGIATNKEASDKFQHVTNRKLIAPPGTYDIQFKDRLSGFLLKDGKGKVLAPLEGDWQGNFATGFQRITITE